MPRTKFTHILHPIEWIALSGLLFSVLLVLLHGRSFYFLAADHLEAVQAYSSWLLPCFFAKVVFALRSTPPRRTHPFYLAYFFLLTLSFFGTRIEQSFSATALLKHTMAIVTRQNVINLALLALTLGYVAWRCLRTPRPAFQILKIELTEGLLALRLLVSLLLAFIIYSNILAIVPLIHAGICDGFFFKLDMILFFGANPFAKLATFDGPIFTRLMEKSYEFFFFFIVFGLTGTFLLGNMRQFEKTLAGIVVIYLIGLFCFIAWPTLGPAFYSETAAFFRATSGNGLKRYLLTQYIQFCKDPLHAGVTAFNGMAAFPSLHIAHSTFFLLCLWRANRWLVALLLIPYLLLALSTVYLGWHYLADIWGGLLLAWGAFRLVDWIYPEPPASPDPEAAPKTETAAAPEEVGAAAVK